MRKLRLLLLSIVVAGLLGAGLAGRGPRGVATADAVSYDRFDVDIAIEPSGDFRVTEKQLITFPSGTFTRASRNIGLDSVTDVRDVVVSSGSQTFTQATNTTSRTPNTFSLTRSASNLKIEWYFPQAAGQQRPFAIAYTVVGGLRINPDVDVLDWTALRPDLPADAAAATVTVTLPQAVAPGQLKTDSRGATAKATVVDGRTVRFDAGAVNRGKGLEVKVSFPHGLVAATAPPWQSQFEQQAAAQAKRESIQNLLTLVSFVFGFLILIGGGISLYLLWYTRGRDRHVGLVADYLREPPSDISPGIAGTLIDERADLQDVLATFADLGRKGVLHIDEMPPGPLGGGGGRDFHITRQGKRIELSTFERLLLTRLFTRDHTQIRWSEAAVLITGGMQDLRKQLYTEVVALGYFTASPEATRRHYRVRGLLLLIGVVIVGYFAFMVAAFTGHFPFVLGGSFILAPLGILGLGLIGLTGAMPIKTALGAAEATKWRAFKHYLPNLERYDNLADAKELFERYLPYATAFGRDQGFIQKFAAVHTPAPAWYSGAGPIIFGTPDGTHGRFSESGEGPIGESGFQVPPLQELSDRGGVGLQGWSDGLAAMLSSAGSFSSGGGSVDSGWSSSGGTSGGGGGGGGGGSGSGDFRVAHPNVRA